MHKSLSVYKDGKVIVIEASDADQIEKLDAINASITEETQISELSQMCVDSNLYSVIAGDTEEIDIAGSRPRTIKH